jgi:hypothetical protein
MGSSPYSAAGLPPNFNQSPAGQMQPAATHDQFYSLGGAIGGKFRLAGSVSLFAEVSHFFYSSLSDRGTFYQTGSPYLDQAYNAKRNPTYLSLGLTYELVLGN